MLRVHGVVRCKAEVRVVVGDAPEDAEAFVASASHKADQATDLEPSKVKQEPDEELSEIDRINQQIQALLLDPKPVYDEFTTMIVQVKKIIQGAKTDSDKALYSGALIKDTETL